jgi:hypothetical protein
VKRRFKWTFLSVTGVFGLLQLSNVGRHNPPVTPGHDLFSTNPPPAQIAAILRTSCYDCHSYETRWPWYGHVAPVTWWLDQHVRDARDLLNFSEWPHNNPAKAARKWNHVADQVRGGEMPLASYTLIHKNAILTDAQRKELADWAEKESERLKGSE